MEVQENKKENELILYTVDDVQRIFHICKKTAYSLMRTHGFPLIQINKKMFAEKSEVEKWIHAHKGKEIRV